MSISYLHVYINNRYKIKVFSIQPCLPWDKHSGRNLKKEIILWSSLSIEWNIFDFVKCSSKWDINVFAPYQFAKTWRILFHVLSRPFLIKRLANFIGLACRVSNWWVGLAPQCLTSQFHNAGPTKPSSLEYFYI